MKMSRHGLKMSSSDVSKAIQERRSRYKILGNNHSRWNKCSSTGFANNESAKQRFVEWNLSARTHSATLILKMKT